MSLETRKERIIFLGIVPIMAAVCGALATTMFSNASCELGPGTDFVSVLSNQNLTGAQKLKALEIYQAVTDRPWNVVRSLMMILMMLGATLVWALADRIRGK